MPPSSPVQHNLYKGMAPRCWVRLRFVAADGSLHERELIADTGCPRAVILGQGDLTVLGQGPTNAVNSNFGPLTGRLLELDMPELGLTGPILGYGSDNVWQAVQHDSPDFAGLVGLPVLRMVEYGGDSTSFWVAKPSGAP